LMFVPDDEDTIQVALMGIENGYVLGNLIGYGKDFQPPTEPADVLKILKGPFVEEFREVFTKWEMVMPWVAYHGLQTFFRRFDLMAPEIWPNNFVVLGDAVCSFNPAYGQGMTSAATQALVLDGILREHVLKHFSSGDWCGIGHQAQKAFAPHIENFWNTGAAEDLVRSTTQIISGVKMTAGVRMAQIVGYELVSYMLNSGRDNLVIFWQVAQLLKPPAAFGKPSVIVGVFFRVLRRLIFGKRKVSF